MTKPFTLKWPIHLRLNDSRTEGAPQRGNKRIAQGRAKRHPGYETHTKTRPTGAKALSPRQRETISRGCAYAFAPAGRTPYYPYSQGVAGLCAFASPRRFSTHHHFLIHNSQCIIYNYGFNPQKSARSAEIRVPSPHAARQRKNLRSSVASGVCVPCNLKGNWTFSHW